MDDGVIHVNSPVKSSCQKRTQNAYNILAEKPQTVIFSIYMRVVKSSS